MINQAMFELAQHGINGMLRCPSSFIRNHVYRLPQSHHHVIVPVNFHNRVTLALYCSNWRMLCFQCLDLLVQSVQLSPGSNRANPQPPVQLSAPLQFSSLWYWFGVRFGWVFIGKTIRPTMPPDPCRCKTHDPR